ncbi:MAG: ribosome-associated translation inhibitor RaiA [Planctomycetota bacterium]|nr:MAG: ribosome-associated translation inhibitor RaiA [Planctomycetota bacterium]
MRIEISGRGLTLTDPIRAYAEDKAQKVLKYFDGVQEVEVVLGQERRDHREECTAELIVAVVGREPFIAKAEGADVYAALDVAADKAGRQLKEYKERLRDHH